MALWPFGRDPANVEFVSRVVNATTKSGYRLRGKLTIHFAELVRQSAADSAGDRCADLAVALLREAPDQSGMLTLEASLSAQLTEKYPFELARAQSVELAGLHVAGDPALSDELRRPSAITPLSALGITPGSFTPLPPPASSAPPPPGSIPPPAAMPVLSPLPPPVAAYPRHPSSVPPPPGASSTPPPPQVTQSKLSSVRPPPGPTSVRPPASQYPRPPSVMPPAASPGTMPPRRRSSQIRSVRALLMPPGTPPSGMGTYVAPLARDSATRLLIGFLRAHDLIAVRGIVIDTLEGDMIAAVVPVSDAAPGGYEASRAAEIARWKAALGDEAVDALFREAKVTCLALFARSLFEVQVMAALALAVVEASATAAFPEIEGATEDLGRFPAASSPEFVAMVAESMTTLAGGREDKASMTTALTPLVQAVRDDMLTAAMIVQQSAGV